MLLCSVNTETTSCFMFEVVGLEKLQDCLCFFSVLFLVYKVYVQLTKPLAVDTPLEQRTSCKGKEGYGCLNHRQRSNSLAS